MDPLSALGLASNVVQFVQFAVSLVNGTREIHSSAVGASDSSQRLDGIYTTLSKFGKALGARSRRGTEEKPSVHAQALEDMAAGCQQDCNALLELVHRFRVRPGSKAKWWRSFQKMMLETWSQSEVEKLKQRISDSQGLMVVLLCGISR